MTPSVYTKTGDQGRTSLIGGKRVCKFDTRIEAYGSLDELSSFIGLLKTEPAASSCREELQHIQEILVSINSLFALYKAALENRIAFPDTHIQYIEACIDCYQAQQPPFQSFLIPGSNRAEALCHVCRTVCRRAERCICKSLSLVRNPTNEDDSRLLEKQKRAAVFINRLSDYFFVLGRSLA